MGGRENHFLHFSATINRSHLKFGIQHQIEVPCCGIRLQACRISTSCLTKFFHFCLWPVKLHLFIFHYPWSWTFSALTLYCGLWLTPLWAFGLIRGYQFLWFREETQVCGFLEFVVLKLSVYTSMEISFSMGNKFCGLTHENHENWYPTNNSTLTFVNLNSVHLFITLVLHETFLLKLF